MLITCSFDNIKIEAGQCPPGAPPPTPSVEPNPPEPRADVAEEDNVLTEPDLAAETAETATAAARTGEQDVIDPELLDAE